MFGPTVSRPFLTIGSLLALLLLFSGPPLGVRADEQDPGDNDGDEGEGPACGTVPGDEQAVAAPRAAPTRAGRRAVALQAARRRPLRRLRPPRAPPYRRPPALPPR